MLTLFFIVVGLLADVSSQNWKLSNVEDCSDHMIKTKNAIGKFPSLQCSLECETTEGCHAFAIQESACLLIGKVHLHQEGQAQVWIPQNRTIVQGCLEEGVQFFNYQMLNLQKIKDFEDCVVRCLRLDKCKGVSWNEQTLFCNLISNMIANAIREDWYSWHKFC